MSKQKKNNFLPKDMLTRLDEQIEFFTARRHFSYVGFFEECKKEIEQLRHDLSRAVEREAEHLAEAEQLQARVQELEDMAKDYREKVRSWASKALHENAEKCRLEAENAELRAEVYCNKMCVRYWPSHHVECCYMATRLKRIKQQADDEGEA